MKRNLYLHLLLLFFLAACQPNSIRKDVSTSSVPLETETNTPTPKATNTVIPTSTLIPTPTPESIQINSDIPKIPFEILQRITNGEPGVYYDYLLKNGRQNTIGYSIVNFEDLISGEILLKEQAYIFQHPPFSGEVKNDGLWIADAYNESFKEKAVATFSNYLFAYNPTMRFIKLISIYNFNDDEFFKKNGVDPIKNFGERNPPYTDTEKENIDSDLFWLLTWAYQNPDGEVKIIHTFENSFFEFVFDNNKVKNNLDLDCQFGNELKPRFTYTYKFNIPLDEVQTHNWWTLGVIYENYPELKPETRFIDQWVRTREFPDELENKLFGYHYGWCW